MDKIILLMRITGIIIFISVVIAYFVMPGDKYCIEIKQTGYTGTGTKTINKTCYRWLSELKTAQEAYKQQQMLENNPPDATSFYDSELWTFDDVYKNDTGEN